ncbi:MAG: primosomal protein N' [Bacillota bacterium]
MSFAEIIIDHKSSSVDKQFTYRIPPELEDEARTGVRVVVPFGRYNKPMMGIMVGKNKDSHISNRIKDIIRVLDDKPLISEKRLKLAKWIKDEYLCTGIESLQPILPPGDFRNINTIVEPGKALKTYQPESDDEREIITALWETDRIEYSDLQEKIKCRYYHKAIRNLEEADAIRLVLDVKKKSAARVEKIVLRNSDIPYLEGVDIAGNNAKKQQKIWDYMKSRNEISVKDLLQEFNTSLSVLKAMEKKGLVSIVNRIINEKPVSNSIPMYEKIELNSNQKKVYEGILHSKNRYSLIHGVTGSGKTEIYLQLVENMLSIDKDSIILVPEIALTPQTIDRFVGRFGNKVAILHSKLTQIERFDQWRRIKAGEYKIVVGARSALFAPFKNLGLVVIDEEHENTYKSSNNPKYNTVDVAIKICQLDNSKLVLGTATPSVETYYRADKGEFALYELQSRATRNTLPFIQVVDMRDELHGGNRSIFSRSLFKEMKRTLEDKNQIILFLNRRGYAGFITCRSCGYVAKCNNCDISLTYHRSTNRLRCHYCGDTHTIPRVCPSCGSQYFKSFGIGTEKVEEEVRKLFPDARVQRMDSDSVKTRDQYEKALESMKHKEVDILIGTQMISKGLDFPGVTLVGIIAADTTLNLPDYKSPERTFQLVTQVAGRAGRGEDPGRVILQTYNPDHYSIISAMNSNYKEFYEQESRLREEFGYPPYKVMASITLFGENYEHVKDGIEISSRDLEEMINSSDTKSIEVLGPHPAPLERINNNYRWQILLKFDYNDNESIKQIIDRVYINGKDKIKYDDLKISIDINPSSIL